MDRNSVFLIYIFISVTIFALTNCSRQKKEKIEYMSVDWIPSNKDIAGIYMLDRNYHEDLPKDSIFLKFNDDSTFIAKNFFYSEFGWDSI